MVNDTIKIICESRLLIGFLGEKHQAGWWDSSFLSKSSISFLAPVYPNSILSAQYYGVCQAASKVHDEHIGLGRNYHLYRLPDSIERLLAKTLQDKEFSSLISNNISEKNSVMSRLIGFCGVTVDLAEGPIAIGDFSDDTLDGLIRKSLSYYLKAFENNCKSFPYMRYL